MPHPSSTRAHPCHPVLQLRLALAVVLMLALVACAGGGEADRPMDPAATDPAAAVALATAPPNTSGDTGGDLCLSVASVEQRLASLRAVELRLPNRVALDIELGKLQAAFAELRQADLGAFEEQLETPLQRLNYRLAELELAVEDFRTNSRPARAVPHVEADAETLAGELAAFFILARC